MNVKIVDVLGNAVSSENYFGNSGVNMITVNTENISKGLYQLVICTESAEKSIKVIVQ